jgi:hypothetical protein
VLLLDQQLREFQAKKNIEEEKQAVVLQSLQDKKPVDTQEQSHFVI